MSRIDETMVIGDILDQHPEMRNILLANGLNCLGCPGSYRETLEEAAAGHGVDLAKILSDLNSHLTD